MKSARIYINNVTCISSFHSVLVNISVILFHLLKRKGAASQLAGESNGHPLSQLTLIILLEGKAGPGGRGRRGAPN